MQSAYAWRNIRQVIHYCMMKNVGYDIGSNKMVTRLVPPGPKYKNAFDLFNINKVTESFIQEKYGTGHGGVVSISTGQPSKRESEGPEFESPYVPRFMSNMLAPRDLSICLCNGLQLKFVRLGSNVRFTCAVKLSHWLLTQINNHNKGFLSI